MLFLFPGIWDCLSSQEVVDFIRYQVSKGLELTEIAELIFEHCLAPDTTSGAGIGCDNMTILIVAILHGRTKEQWYDWVTERVTSGYGYRTPSSVPQLYAQSRLLSFRARREALEARNRSNVDPEPSFETEEILRRYGLNVTTISSGISYRPGGNITSDSGDQLMFGSEDSDEEEEEDSDEEETGGRSVFTESLGLGRESPDPTKNLREQLEEFEKGEGSSKQDKDEDSDMDAESPIGEPRHIPSEYYLWILTLSTLAVAYGLSRM